MIDGLFIAIEGIDGAGTTTQAAKLFEALQAKGLPVHLTREPSDGPIGVLIRQILSGRVVVPGVHGVRPPDWTTMALLFAADRVDHVDAEIVPNLMDGVTVITDRFDYSSVAYQSMTSDDGDSAIDWVRTINARARRPDLTIVLDVPSEIAAQRRQKRAKAPEVLAEYPKLAAFYADIERHFPNDKVVHVDGASPLDVVAAEILRAVVALRGERT